MNLFTITQKVKHGLKTYTLGNALKKWEVDIIPALGARVNCFEIDLSHKRHSIIKGFDTQTDITSNSVAGYYGAHLFPFPNRIEDGRYEFEGKNYQLPINEGSRNHAIHGFLHDQSFNCVKEVITSNEASIVLQYEATEGFEGYPFHFVFELKYTLNQTGLHIQARVENSDAISFPVSYGWHPYIDLDAPVNELVITVPSRHYLEIDERFLLTGSSIPLDKPLDQYTLNEDTFDHCFVLDSHNTQHKTRLVNPINDLSVTLHQESGSAGLNYLHLFTPDRRDCIAMEPVSCIPNAFNTHLTDLMLQPGGRRQWSCSLIVTN